MRTVHYLPHASWQGRWALGGQGASGRGSPPPPPVMHDRGHGAENVQVARSASLLYSATSVLRPPVRVSSVAFIAIHSLLPFVVAPQAKSSALRETGGCMGDVSIRYLMAETDWSYFIIQ